MQLWYKPRKNEGVISPNPQGNHNSQDVHEWEEAKTEDEGVGEVGQAQGVSNGGYACHCHSEARCEAPH